MSIHDGENILLAKRARRVWGPNACLIKGAEEAGELVVAALHHHDRATAKTKSDLATEMADVEINLARMRLLFEGDADFRILAHARRTQQAKYTKAIEAAEQELFERGELSDAGASKAMATRALDGLSGADLAEVLALYSPDRPTVVFLPGESKP